MIVVVVLVVEEIAACRSKQLDECQLWDRDERRQQWLARAVAVESIRLRNNKPLTVFGERLGVLLGDAGRLDVTKMTLFRLKQRLVPDGNYRAKQGSVLPIEVVRLRQRPECCRQVVLPQIADRVVAAEQFVRFTDETEFINVEVGRGGAGAEHGIERTHQ